MSSPVFTESSAFAKGAGNYPKGEVMTLDNTMRKSVLIFTLTVAAMAVGWLFLPAGIVALAAISAFALSLVCIFKKEPSPPLFITTTVLYGLAIGAISGFLEVEYPGIVVQAVLATVVVIATIFALYRSGKFRSSPKMTKIFVAVTAAYVLFSLVNLGLMVTGLNDNAWGMRSHEVFGVPVGIPLGILAVVLGAYSLILDFEFIENGIAIRLPAKYGWTAAYGLVLTIVWIYFEILRLLSFFRQ